MDQEGGSVSDSGESRGGARGTRPLFLDQAEAQGPKKNFLRAGPLLSRGLDDPPPPYLKVWIRHCLRNEHKVQGCPEHAPPPFSVFL